MEVALEAGAEDFQADEEGYEVLTDPAHFEQVHKQIEGKGIKCASAEVTYLPLITVAPQNPEAVGKLVEALEEHDDVKEVYTNAEFPG